MLGRSQVLWLIVSFVGLTLFSTGCQAIAASYEYKGNLLDSPKPIADFELTASDGSRFHLSDLEGKIVLVFFGYTHCPDICPLTVAKVKNALDGLDETEREQVEFVFISVDPERDTPEVLARYLNSFNPEFIGLTDDFEKTQAVLASFWAYAEKEALAEPAADQAKASHSHDNEASPNYLVSHTGRVYLVTPQRELLLMYPFEFTAEDLRNDLVYLLKQS